MDLDEILKIIHTKVLKDTHLLVTGKEIQAGNLHSSCCKDAFLYLVQTKLPSNKAEIMKTDILADRYLLLDSLLFTLNTTPGKESAVPAISESCVDKIITLYHLSIFGEHQGSIKTCLTINEKIFIPDLIHNLRAYIKGCHRYQLHRKKKSQSRQLQQRLYPNIF